MTLIALKITSKLYKFIPIQKKIIQKAAIGSDFELFKTASWREKLELPLRDSSINDLSGWLIPKLPVGLGFASGDKSGESISPKSDMDSAEGEFGLFVFDSLFDSWSSNSSSDSLIFMFWSSGISSSRLNFVLVPFCWFFIISLRYLARAFWNHTWKTNKNMNYLISKQLDDIRLP